MFRRKNRLQFTGDAAKVEQMYEEKEKDVTETKKQQKKTKREKGIVAIMAVLGMMGLMGFALYLLLLIPLPENAFAKLIPWAIYIFVILPLFGWLIILIGKHIYGD
jgi:uncharacterized BrkB/YihY/UPF0761 family membrane protein